MGTSLEGDIMRTETEIRRRLVYLMQQKGYLMQDIDYRAKNCDGAYAEKLRTDLGKLVAEIKVLQWILRMEDN